MAREIQRVLIPGGHAIADFDNRISRMLLAVPHLIYNIVRYRRLAPDTHYNTGRSIRRLFEDAGLRPLKIVGVGGYHLVIPATLSTGLATRLGRTHQQGVGRCLSEQLMAVATKP